MATKKTKLDIIDATHVDSSVEIPHDEIISPKKSITKSKIVAGVLCFIVILGGYLWYKEYQNSPKAVAERTAKEQKEVVVKVREHIILPESLTPEVIMIEDPELLVRQQTFFAGSIKGDYLMVYPELSKAIIYSPSRDIIVNVGPITGGEGAELAPAPAPRPE